jgi:hypothetical protein
LFSVVLWEATTLLVSNMIWCSIALPISTFLLQMKSVHFVHNHYVCHQHQTLVIVPPLHLVPGPQTKSYTCWWHYHIQHSIWDTPGCIWGQSSSSISPKSLSVLFSQTYKYNG